SLDQGDRDMATLTAMTAQFESSMLPALAAQLHMTPQQFAATLAGINPTVARSLGQLDAPVAFVKADQARKAATAADFRDADDIPTSGTAPTIIPWTLIVPGVLLLAGGLYGLLRPARATAALAGLTAVGVVVVAGLLATGMHGKSQGATRLVDQ